MKIKSNIRVDKWLWFARFFKNRSISAKVVANGKVRLNGKRISKPATFLKRGDGLTFSQGNVLRVIRVLELGHRRGPASEAALLYDEIKDRISVDKVVYSEEIPIDTIKGEFGSKPTKRQRRDILKLKNSY